MKNLLLFIIFLQRKHMPNTAFRATHNNFQHPITSHKEPFFFFFFLIWPSHFSANSMNLTRCFSKLQGGDPFTGGFGSGLLLVQSGSVFMNSDPS